MSPNAVFVQKDRDRLARSLSGDQLSEEGLILR